MLWISVSFGFMRFLGRHDYNKTASEIFHSLIHLGMSSLVCYHFDVFVLGQTWCKLSSACPSHLSDNMITWLQDNSYQNLNTYYFPFQTICK